MSLALIAVLISSIAGYSSPAFAKANPRYASLVMDADTGVVLSQSNPDKKLHPASLTKVMTLLMVFEAIEQGKLTLRDRVPVSRHAASMAPSKLGLEAGSSIRVQDGIYAMVTKSANDVAVAFAEKLGGTEGNFGRMMTARARQLGMNRTNFVNASGLHDKRQISTARDMATLARTVIKQYPGYYRYFSTANFSYKGHNYHNHNRLMETYKGMDGMKTGYVGASGFNLVASAVRNNRRLIGVVFGGTTASKRNAEMEKLLNMGFNKAGDVRIARADPAPLPEKLAPVATRSGTSPAPIPPHKPAMLAAVDSLARVMPAAGSVTHRPPVKMASIGPILDSAKFSELTGEGDMDISESKRIETGLVAVSAVKGGEVVKPSPRLLTGPSSDDTWLVQIGAYSSRAATDSAIHSSIKKLPVSLASATPAIAPLKVKDGWVFRARLAGYTREQAYQACSYLKDCIPVAPRSN